jgi:hypothetical protein
MAVLYRECRAGPGEDAADGSSRVTCTVRVKPGETTGMVTLEDGEPLDMAEFIFHVFPDRGYREIRSDVPGWRVVALGSGDGGGSVAVSGSQLLFRAGDPWRALAGSVAVSRLIRLQRRLIFFHAASIGVSGSGVMLIGPKGAGKTTLSLALAARGHSFLGDEIAGVRRADAVSDALERMTAPLEIYPDGSERLRAQAAELFPSPPPTSLPLGAVVFLCGFGPEARLERFEPGREHLQELTPIGATLWAMSPARRAFDMLSLLSRARCYRMVMGGPEDSAACIERVMEE